MQIHSPRSDARTCTARGKEIDEDTAMGRMDPLRHPDGDTPRRGSSAEAR